MAEPRTSSVNRAVKGYPSVRKESQKEPDSESGHTGHRDGYGMGKGKGFKSSYAANATDRPPMREVYARELAWAEQHLPGEYGPFVALAIESLKRRGVAPSTKSVLGHLSALGRDAASRGGV